MIITPFSWAILGNIGTMSFLHGHNLGPIFLTKALMLNQLEVSTDFCKNDLHCTCISGYFEFQSYWFPCYSKFIETFCTWRQPVSASAALKSISSYISTPKCKYFTVFPVIIPIYTNMDVSWPGGNTCFISFDQ